MEGSCVLESLVGLLHSISFSNPLESSNVKRLIITDNGLLDRSFDY